MSSVEQIATKIEEVAELLSLQSDHPKRDRADILRDVMVEAGRELMEHAAALREQPEARGVVDDAMVERGTAAAISASTHYVRHASGDAWRFLVRDVLTAALTGERHG